MLLGRENRWLDAAFFVALSGNRTHATNFATTLLVLFLIFMRSHSLLRKINSLSNINPKIIKSISGKGKWQQDDAQGKFKKPVYSQSSTLLALQRRAGATRSKK